MTEEIGAKSLAPEAADKVASFVDNSFTAAQEYAKSAWDNAKLAISELSTIELLPVDDSDISLEMDLLDLSVDRLDVTAPDNITLSSIEYPDLPQLDTLEQLPDISPLFSPLVSLTTAFVARLQTMIEEGSTGLDTAAEQAIWDRALRRKELEDARQYAEAEQYFSARGYELPPGALAARLQEISIEIGRRNDDLNNDILIQQSKLAQSNMQYLLESASSHILEIEKTTIGAIIDANKAKVDIYTAELEAYRSVVATKIAIIESEVKVYSERIGAYKATVEAGATVVNAQSQYNLALIEQVRAVADITIKKLEFKLEEARTAVALQTEALKAVAQVSSQVAASALSAVNASANYGFSGGANIGHNVSLSYGWDQTKGVDTGVITNRQLSA